jgi:hypothetical protein
LEDDTVVEAVADGGVAAVHEGLGEAGADFHDGVVGEGGEVGGYVAVEELGAAQLGHSGDVCYGGAADFGFGVLEEAAEAVE